MANIKSARKRVQVTARNTLRNKIYLTRIKTYTKKFVFNLSNYQSNSNSENYTALRQSLNLVFSAIDKGVKVNALHRNTAARKKARLQKIVNQLGS